MKLFPEKHFKVLIRILRIGGSWPEKDSSKAQLLLAFIVHFLLLDLATVLCLVKVLLSGDLEDISEAINLLLTYVMVFLKSINILWKMNDVLHLFDTIKNLMNQVEAKGNKTFEYQVLRSQKLFRVYYATALLSVAASVSQPFFTGKLAVKMWFPYNAERDVVSLYPTAVFQMFSSFHNCSLCIALDMIPIFFMSYVVGFIEILRNNLEQIGASESINCSVLNQAQELKTLVKCVDVHIKIKRIVVEIEELFSGVLMAQGIMSVIILCTTSFSMTVVSIFLDSLILHEIYKFSMLRYRKQQLSAFNYRS